MVGSGVERCASDEHEDPRCDQRSTGSLANVVFRQFAAQRIAIQTKHVRRVGLIASRAVHDHRDERALDIGNHHFVDAVRLLAIELAEIFVERFFDRSAELVAPVDA